LLREIEAGSAILDHADNLVQMALGPAQALDDLEMRLVKVVRNSLSYPPGVDIGNEKGGRYTRHSLTRCCRAKASGATDASPPEENVNVPRAALGIGIG
jgi:hypothetical protein